MKERSKAELRQLLLSKIDADQLSGRAANCLKAEDIITHADLVIYESWHLNCIPNFGPSSYRDILVYLSERGLKIGMKKEEIQEILGVTEEPVIEEKEQVLTDREIRLEVLKCAISYVPDNVYLPEELLWMAERMYKFVTKKD